MTVIKSLVVIIILTTLASSLVVAETNNNGKEAASTGMSKNKNMGKLDIKTLTEKAGKGDVTAMLDLATCYFNGGCPEDLQNGNKSLSKMDNKKALHWLNTATPKTKGKKLFNIGVKYVNGDEASGIMKDKNIAILYWKKAAERNSGDAKMFLKMMRDAKNNPNRAFYIGGEKVK